MNYSCSDCVNLKTRVITKKALGVIKGNDIKEAIGRHDVESLGLLFPFNFTVYKRITRYKECKIIYCSEHMLKRDSYVARENSRGITPEVTPCPRYK